MVRYKVPYDVIEKFCEKAGANKKNGHHIETLAFLVGFKEDDVITVTDMVKFALLNSVYIFINFCNFFLGIWPATREFDQSGGPW